MWLTFMWGVVACLLLLYVPGFLLFRFLGFDKFRSLIIAPIASLASYCLLGIVFAKVDIECSWLSVAVPPCLVFLVLYIVRLIRTRVSGASSSDASRADWASLLLYLCVGVGIGVYVYLIPLGDPEQFLQQYDNAFHMQVVRAFSDSGNWSTLEVSKYMTEGDSAIAPLPSSSFYPALWHLLCALLISVLGCSVALSINVVNFIIACVLFPMGMMLFLSVVFPRKATVRLGSACVLAFAGFPWMLLYWGPLYANVLAFSLAPLAASLFLVGFDSLLGGTFETKVFFALILSISVLVVAQTSSVFLCIILLTSFCVYRIWTLETSVRLRGVFLSSKVLAGLFLVFVILVWAALITAPFMYSMVFEYNWPASLEFGAACKQVATLAVGWVPSQPILAIVILVGIISTFRHREYLWLTVSYTIFAVVYVLCVATDGLPKHFFGGVWYTDPYRVFSCLVIAGIPLASQGLAAIDSFVRARLHAHERIGRLAAGVFLVLFCVLVYRPGVWIGGTYDDSAFGKMRWEFKQGNDHNRPILFDEDEQRFVAQAMEIVSEGSLVANMPDDGSCFAYAVNGLRTYYRDYRDYEGGRYSENAHQIETPESKLIRLSADRIASNDEVRTAFEKLGIRYVLVLDYGEALESQPKVSTYDESLWTGLAAITDETPGFSIVLSDEDMRLYEIMPS